MSRSDRGSVSETIEGMQSRRPPLVSVIIPYYNQPTFLETAVRSACAQTYPHVEIIVVDDGSPVPAEPLLRDIPGVTIIRTENRGLCAARNGGFRASRGEFLIFLDSDDRLTPTGIESHFRALTKFGDNGLSFGAIRIIDKVGHELRPPHICRPRLDYFLMLLEGNFIGCPGAAMIRRDHFGAVGLFDESQGPSGDYDLYLKIARRTSFARSPDCVVEYRRHDANMSSDRKRMLASTMGVLDRLEDSLTERERRILRHGRRRWQHEFAPKDTVAYRLSSLYFKVRAMLTVPVKHYLT